MVQCITVKRPLLLFVTVVKQNHKCLCLQNFTIYVFIILDIIVFSIANSMIGGALIMMLLVNCITLL